MRKFILSLLIIFGGIVLIGSSSLLWAQPPCITVDLLFDKDSYNYGDPVRATVVVTNNCGEDVLISKDFLSRKDYLEIRVIDPVGRLISPLTDEEHDEFPDAPPLAFVPDNNPGNPPHQVTICDVFGAGESKSSETGDLGAYYSFKFPGEYSFEVQLSAMRFKQSEGTSLDPCYGDVNDYESVGVIKSEKKYVYLQGATEVNIIPNYWFLGWKEGKNLIPDLAVTIWPEAGKTVNDYGTDQIKLNDVSAKMVVKMYSILRRTYYLLAFFDKKKSINSLGQVQVGQWYPVVISGMLKDNQMFGGGEKVKIVKILK